MDDVAKERAIYDNLELGVSASEIADLLCVNLRKVFRCETLRNEGTCEFSPAIRSAVAGIRKTWTTKTRKSRLVCGVTRLGIRIIRVPRELCDIFEGDDLV